MTEDKNRKAFRRYAVLAAFVLCLVALGIGMRLTWTAYTGNAYVKGVEVTNATQSLFASDMLVGYYSDPTAEGSTLDVRSVVVSTDSDTCSFSFKIYNCLLDDQNVVNDKDVPYTLSVTSAGIDSSSNWSIAIGGGDSKSYSGLGQKTLDSITLSGLQPTIKEYTITFPKSALGSASFTVKAAVDAGTGSTSDIGTKLNCLAAKIVPNEASSVQAASVTGSLVDKTDSNKPSDYDAYNYRITVTGMETKVTLSWYSSVIEIDPYFKTNHADAVFDTEGTGADAKSTATFTMQPGSTIVNFYQVSNVEQSSWDNLGIEVKQAS